MPLVTVPAAALVAREPVSPMFLVGTAIVLGGVLLGTRRARPDARDAGDPVVGLDPAIR
jgi:drug/metabolite transporter (DMT)-like permease